MSGFFYFYTPSQSLMFDYGRKKISLNGQWNYAVDQYDTCLRQKWFNENYFDAQRNSLPVDFSKKIKTVIKLFFIYTLLRFSDYKF